MPTPTSDLSHLTTLSALAKSAEARTPLPAPAIVTTGSGLIDLKAMEQRARDAASAARSLPVLDPAAAHAAHTAGRPAGAPPAVSEPDLLAAMAAKARRTRLVLGGIAGGAALVAFAAVWLASGSSADSSASVKPVPPAVAEVHAPASMGPSIPPPVAEAVAPASSPAPPSTASVSPSPPKAHRGDGGKVRRTPARAASHGPRLTKVASSGTGG